MNFAFDFDKYVGDENFRLIGIDVYIWGLRLHYSLCREGTWNIDSGFSWTKQRWNKSKNNRQRVNFYLWDRYLEIWF